MSVQRSVVKWFDAKKGYGFILHPNGGEDIFVHYSQILTDERFKTLRTGQLVAFDLYDGPKGVHAHNVAIEEDVENEEASMPAYAAAENERRFFRRPNVFGAARR